MGFRRLGQLPGEETLLGMEQKDDKEGGEGSWKSRGTSEGRGVGIYGTRGPRQWREESDASTCGGTGTKDGRPSTGKESERVWVKEGAEIWTCRRPTPVTLGTRGFV